VVNSEATHSPHLPVAGLPEAALAAVDVPVLITSEDGGTWPIVWVNEAFVRTTGFSASQVMGREPGMLRSPQTDEGVVEQLRTSMRAGVGRTVVLRTEAADGSPFWSRVSVSPVLDGETVTHWVVALVDVTELVDRDVEHAALVGSERRERTSLGLVSQVSDLLMDIDDPHTLREIARLLERGLVRWAGFYLNDGGLRAVEGVDPQTAPSGRGNRHGNVPVDQAVPATGADDPVQQLLDGDREGPYELALGTEQPATSASGWLARQLVERGEAQSRDRLPDDVGSVVLLTVLTLTVRRVGLAVDNVRLYAREHRLAETLQRAMLPEQAEVDGLDVWTYYAPNSEHAQVGGDWYDVLQIAPDVVGVVIGDVVGHDVEAAAAMGQLRSVVRSYLYEQAQPGSVLSRVDQLVAGMRVPRPAGLVLTTLQRRDGGWRADYSRAGHLPALHVRGTEVTRLSGAGGPLIGFGRAPRESAGTDVAPGDFLVFYTDGLIERRDRSLRQGVELLADVVSRITAIDAAGIGEEILSRLADSPEDDVAVVVVRVPGADDETRRSGSPRVRRWVLPGEPASIGRARHAVLRTARTWDLAGVGHAELVVSELVANAVLHGWGQVQLRLYDTGDGLRIEVEDSNPTPPVTTDGHPGRIGGFGMQIVERLADWGWRPSSNGKLVWAKVRDQRG
jgi:PAS domain S-box-containing protein